jgi:UTP--glucose-1-phosphate uridylyltransferase
MPTPADTACVSFLRQVRQAFDSARSFAISSRDRIVADVERFDHEVATKRAGMRKLQKAEISTLVSPAPSPHASAALQAGTSIVSDQRLDWKLLKQYGFDTQRFMKDQARIADGSLSEKSALVTDKLETAPGVSEISWSGPEAERLKTIGEAALAKGEVAVVILNGGMATRFGGVVKGTVDVFDDQSFLELKASDVARASKTYGADIPLVLMNSFATDEATKKHIAERNGLGLGKDQILSFTQSISVRMNPNGSVFIGEDGKPSYHAPGHGDFFESIKRSGVLAELQKRGVKTVLFSNVDNLAATIDPVILGQHLDQKADMTAELVAKRKSASGEWEKGASAVKIGDHSRLVEGFRLPADLSPTEFPDFSTNNFLFSTSALEKDIPLERYVVKKKVKGEPVLQLESITCEASGAMGKDGKPILDLNLVRVPRDGTNSRFFPIKEPEDLEVSRDAIKERLTSGWSQRDAV